MNESVKMDNYMLMCKTLSELQAEWEPKSGDKFGLDWKNGGTEEDFFREKYRFSEWFKEKAVYLPSFEDLIEMLNEHFRVTSDLIPHYFLSYDYDLGDIWDKECVLNFLAEVKWHKEWDWENNKWVSTIINEGGKE